MHKDLRSGKLALGPLLVAAVVALILVAAALTPNPRALAATDAAAATKKPTPTPKPTAVPKPTPTPVVKASTAITGSVLCRGTMAASTDTADLPVGDMYLEMALFTGSPANLPTAKKSVAITGLFLLAINGKCSSGLFSESDTPPCAQEGEFYGSITLGANGGPNPMALSFVANPSTSLTDDPLEGCLGSFQVLPYSKNTQAYFVSTGPITQDPAPGASACGAIGTSMVVGCQEINE